MYVDECRSPVPGPAWPLRIRGQTGRKQEWRELRLRVLRPFRSRSLASR
jgi:hypothetical protein